MTHVVFSHETALKIARANPLLLEEERCSLRADFAAKPPMRHEAEALIHNLTAIPFAKLEQESIHCMLGSSWNRHATARIAAHKGDRTFAEQAFIEVAPDVFIATPELAFVQVAHAFEPAVALYLGVELCGTYCTSWTGFHEQASCEAISSAKLLGNYAKRAHAVSGIAELRRKSLVKFIVDHSASPQETRLALMLGLPTRLGGRGLGMPAMNRTIKADHSARSITGSQSFRADLSWPPHRIDVEYASKAHHSDPASRVRDLKREHALEHLGWNVMQISEADIASIETLDAIAGVLRKRFGLGKPTLPHDFAARKRHLRDTLFSL